MHGGINQGWGQSVGFGSNDSRVEYTDSGWGRSCSDRVAHSREMPYAATEGFSLGGGNCSDTNIYKSHEPGDVNRNSNFSDGNHRNDCAADDCLTTEDPSMSFVYLLYRNDYILAVADSLSTTLVGGKVTEIDNGYRKIVCNGKFLFASTGNNMFLGSLTFEQYVNRFAGRQDAYSVAREMLDDMIEDHAQRKILICTFEEEGPTTYLIGDESRLIIDRNVYGYYAAGSNEAVRLCDMIRIPNFQSEDIAYVKTLFQTVHWYHRYGKSQVANVGPLAIMYKMYKDGNVDKIVDMADPLDGLSEE